MEEKALEEAVKVVTVRKEVVALWAAQIEAVATAAAGELQQMTHSPPSTYHVLKAIVHILKEDMGPWSNWASARYQASVEFLQRVSALDTTAERDMEAWNKARAELKACLDDKLPGECPDSNIGSLLRKFIRAGRACANKVMRHVDTVPLPSRMYCGLGCGACVCVGRGGGGGGGGGGEWFSGARQIMEYRRRIQNPGMTTTAWPPHPPQAGTNLSTRALIVFGLSWCCSLHVQAVIQREKEAVKAAREEEMKAKRDELEAEEKKKEEAEAAAAAEAEAAANAEGEEGEEATE